MTPTKTRWGYVPFNYEEYLLLCELWRAVHGRRVMIAAWRRWNAKAPKNRVRRQYRGMERSLAGETPMPEPTLPTVGVQVRTYGSGPTTWRAVTADGPDGRDFKRLEEAYKAARTPAETAAAVAFPTVTMTEVRRWLAQVSAPVPAPTPAV